MGWFNTGFTVCQKFYRRVLTVDLLIMKTTCTYHEVAFPPRHILWIDFNFNHPLVPGPSTLWSSSEHSTSRWAWVQSVENCTSLLIGDRRTSALLSCNEILMLNEGKLNLLDKKMMGYPGCRCLVFLSVVRINKRKSEKSASRLMMDRSPYKIVDFFPATYWCYDHHYLPVLHVNHFF